MRNRKSFLGMKFDARAIFLLAALIGAGSLFVTTLTSEAPETFAEEGATRGVGGSGIALLLPVRLHCSLRASI